jgi:hypothetical protein
MCKHYIDIISGYISGNKTSYHVGYELLANNGIRNFRYNGADFVCAGMFDFQIQEDATFAREAIEKARNRPRPWCV